MKILLIIITIIILLIIFIYITCPNLHLKNNIIPFYKRKDNSFPNINNKKELTIFCTSGLSNRIRTLLGFYYICKIKNKLLNVIWISDNTCNGEFLDYFKNIEGVNFFNKIIDNIDYTGQSTIEIILNNYKIKPTKDIYKELYKNIKPIEDIEKKILSYVKENKIENLLGIHVRRTDYTGNFIGKLLNGSNKDEEFFDFIKTYSKDLPFYIATDNKETQDIYKNKYRNKALFFHKIKYSKNLRKTSLENAIIDIYILSYCRKIKGTSNSSFSEFSKYLKLSRF